MEVINLSVESGVESAGLAGLDAAIAKLERVDALMEKLSGAGSRTVRLGLSVDGLEKLDTAATGAERLTGALRAVGESQWSAKLESSAVGSEAALEGIAGDARAANAALAEGIQLLGQMEARFAKMGTGFGFEDKMARARTIIAGQREEVERLQAAAAMANRAEGAAAGGSVPGESVGLSTTRVEAKVRLAEATEDLGTADRAGAEAARESGGALERQREIAAGKIGVVKDLTVATEALAAADERAAGAATLAGTATQRAEGLMSERTRTDERGRTTTSQRFLTGPGQTLTRSGESTVEETDYLQRYKTQFEKLDADFAGRRSGLTAAGSAPGSRAHIAVLDAEVAARREIVVAMAAEGLAEDSLALKQTIKANQTDATARAAELKVANAGLTESERAQTEALRENLALMDRAVIIERGLATSEEARIGILRRQAAAYGELAAGIREAGESAPGRTPLLRSAEGKESRLNNEAAQLEAARRRERADAEAQSVRLMQEYETGGLTEKRRTTRQGPAGTETILTGERAANGLKESVTLTQKLSAEGEVLATTLTRVESSAAAAGRGVASANRSLFSNVATITAWAAGAAVLYGSLNLVKEGFGGMMEAQAASARLENVFRGGAAGAQMLRDDLLELAAANGRAGEEAIKSGIAYERLGYNQRDVLSLTSLALKEANVSESTATEVTSALTPVMRGYGLSVAQTGTFLAEMNATAANANVTSKDLLMSISRVAPVARAAGVSLSELSGIAAVMSEGTGKAGSDVGTMIRSLAIGFENPTLQKFLAKEFKFDVKTDTGQMKQLSTLLSELYVKYQGLSQLEQGELISKTGGKKQGAGLMAVLDGYVESQMLAIKASRDLGATEEQNTRIRQTSLSQLETINTEFRRMFVNLGNVGGAFGFTSQLTGLITAVGNVLHLGAEFAPVFAAVIALLAVMAVRLVRSAAAMGENVGEGNILMTTLRSLQSAWTSLGVAIERTNGQMTTANRLMGTAKVAGAEAAAGVEGAAVAGVAEKAVSKGPSLLGVGGLALGTLFSPEMLVAVGTIAALEAGMWAFNKALEAMRSDSDDASDKLAAMNAELERTNALLDGTDRTGKLAGTLSKALPKLNERDPERAKRAVGDFATVAYSEDEDAGGGRRAALREELTGLLEQGRIKEAQARLDEVQARLQREKVNLAEQSETQGTKLLAQQEQSLALINREITDRKAAGRDTVDQEKQRKQVMDAMAKSRGDLQRSFSTLAGDEEDGGPRREGDEDFKKSIEARQKGIDAVYEALPSSSDQTDVSKFDRELEKLDARKAMLEAQKQADEDATEASRRGAQDRLAAAQKELDGYRSLREARARDEEAAHQAKLTADEGAHPAALYPLPNEPGYQKPVTQETLDERSRAAQATLESFDRTNSQGLAGEVHARDELEAAKSNVDAQREITSAKAEQIAANEKTLEQERESVQLQRDKYAALKDALTEGERQGRREPEAFKIGRDDVEKMFNESGGIAPLFDQAIARYQSSKASGDGVGQNRAAGEALQLGNRLSEIALSLDERRFRVQADIVNERIKENAEASKSLAFASREDQLRAALLAKYEQTNGAFTSAQFQNLDQSTRESVRKFTPEALPGEAGGKEQELRREQAMIGTNLAGLSSAVKATTDYLNANVKLATAPLPGQNTPAAPQITAPNITFTFGQQFNALAQTLQQTVISRFDGELAIIKNTLATVARRSPVNTAQTPGVDVSTGN